MVSVPLTLRRLLPRRTRRTRGVLTVDGGAIPLPPHEDRLVRRQLDDGGTIAWDADELAAVSDGTLRLLPTWEAR